MVVQSRADLFHEKLISEFLGTEIKIISEESYKGLKIFRLWLYSNIRPNRHTENFASGLKEWGVALSIWQNGKHFASALYLPEMRDYLFSGQNY